MRDKNIRKTRIENLLRATIYEIIVKNIKDPRVHNVNITKIMLSSDFRFAKVYFSILTDVNEDRSKQELECLSGLNSAKNFIKYLILKQTDLRYIPELDFYIDKTFDYAEKIGRIVDRIGHGKKRS